MFDKINRNDPCPCGSGKKFKKCCMGKVEMDTHPNTGKYSRQNNCESVFRYFQTHSTKDVLNFVIGLQLSPSNHGKNVRIEDLARLAVLSMHIDDSRPVSCGELKALLDKDYGHNCMEDLPCNMFSENVAYFGGAYTVFPGITYFAIEILNGLLQAVFKSKCGLPVDLQNRIHEGVQCLLDLGKYISNCGGIEGNIIGADFESSNLDCSMCSHDYSVPKTNFKNYLSTSGLDPNIIDQFVLDVNDRRIISVDPDQCPFLQKPVVEYNDRYYFLLISNQANAISSFIMRTLLEYHYADNVARAFHQGLWNEIRQGCTRMKWPLTNIPLPLNNEVYIDEVVAQFDVNWLAYICYVHDEGENMRDALNGGYRMLSVDDHIKQAVDFIKSHSSNIRVLTLILYSSLGEMVMMPHGGADSEDYRLSFSAFDFIDLTKSENWNNLSLLRFAQTVKCHEGSFNPTQDSLDLYSIYKLYGESFYMTDKQPYSYMIIPPDDGRHLIFEAKLKRDFKLIPFDKDGEQLLMSVVSSNCDMPIYEPSRIINGYYTVTLAYEQPIWIFCDQVGNQLSYEYRIADLFGMSLAFWLTKMYQAISILLRSQYKSPIFIELIFDSELFDEHKYMLDYKDFSPEDALTVVNKNNGIQIYLHRFILSMVCGGNNCGERIIMGRVLNALLSMNDSEVESILNNYMPLGPSKMIVVSTSTANEILDNRWLVPPILLSKAIDQLVLDSLPQMMDNKGVDIDGLLANEKERLEFLHNLVNVLLEDLNKQVLKCDKALLLKRLVDVNESLIWQREQDAIRIPAKILCLGEDSRETKIYIEQDKVLTESSLAARCLAEYVVSLSEELEGLVPGVDEIECMMALMRAVCTFGSLADALKLGVSDVSVEKLESGRYSISDDSFQDGISGFAEANVEEEIRKHILSFSRRLDNNIMVESQSNHAKSKNAVSGDDVNDAFMTDWGVSYSDIDAFCYGCYSMCVKHQTSSLVIGVSDFIQEMHESQPILSSDAISICLQHFTLTPRNNYLTAPVGHPNHDVYPWVYNREFSYIRRFILSYSAKSEEYFVFGPRSAMAALRQLTKLLVDGRLKVDTKALSALRGKFNDIKGRLFNDEVREYLKGSSGLMVFDYEVEISKDGNLKADKNYGDIDVLAYDSERKILFSIECKDTEKARNIREMKTELDKYLGREDTGKIGYIEKHRIRHEWLVEHVEDVKVLIKETLDVKIVSFVLTSEVIPLSYISKRTPSLPIIAFSELKAHGVSIIYNDLSLEKE